jgi:hypothetical protein
MAVPRLFACSAVAAVLATLVLAASSAEATTVLTLPHCKWSAAAGKRVQFNGISLPTSALDAALYVEHLWASVELQSNGQMRREHPSFLTGVREWLSDMPLPGVFGDTLRPLLDVRGGV